MLTPRAERLINRSLRLAAVIGAGAAVAHWLREGDLASRSEVILSLFLLSTTAVALFLVTGLSGSFRKALRHKDLLVPHLLFTAVDGALRYVLTESRFSSLNEPVWDINAPMWGQYATPLFLVASLNTVIYVGWLTDLILQTFLRQETDLFRSLRNIRHWFWKALVGLLIGEAGIFVLVYSIAWLPTAPRYVAAGLVALGWNLATSALLLTLLAAERLTWRQILRGFTASWKVGPRILLPLAVQLAILGCVNVSPVKSNWPPPRAAGADVSAAGLQVSVFWAGDYTEYSKWYSRAMRDLRLPSSRLMVALFAFMLTILAITIKVKILEELSAMRLISAESDGDQVGDGLRLQEPPSPTATWDTA